MPPQVQTPSLIHEIAKAFAKFGITPAQFMAGSPASSHNPATGAPEYNFLSSLLPMLAGGAAAVAAPALAPAALSSALGGALVPAAAGLASAGASAATGGNANQALMAGLGSAGGAALGGGLLGKAGSGLVPPTGATPGLGSAAAAGSNPFGSANNPEVGPFSSLAQSGAAQVANPSNVIPANASQAPWLRSALGAGVGAGVGSALAPATAKSVLPAGFNSPLPALNTNWGQLNGSGASPTAQFQGYNPYSVASGSGYTFYPQS